MIETIEKYMKRKPARLRSSSCSSSSRSSAFDSLLSERCRRLVNRLASDLARHAANRLAAVRLQLPDVSAPQVTPPNQTHKFSYMVSLLPSGGRDTLRGFDLTFDVHNSVKPACRGNHDSDVDLPQHHGVGATIARPVSPIRYISFPRRCGNGLPTAAASASPTTRIKGPAYQANARWRIRAGFTIRRQRRAQRTRRLGRQIAASINVPDRSPTACRKPYCAAIPERSRSLIEHQRHFARSPALGPRAAA